MNNLSRLLLLFFALILLNSFNLGKTEWDYTATCAGYSDKGIVNVEITAYGDDQKTLDEYLKKCAVHAAIFRGLAPSKENMCSFQEPILKEMFAEEDHAKFFKKFFNDKGPYSSFVSIIKENKGSELYYKGQGYKKTMVFSVRREAIESMLVENQIKK